MAYVKAGVDAGGGASVKKKNGGRVDPQSAMTVRTLSSRPDMVSCGNALVEILGSGSMTGLAVTLNGQDVTGTSRPHDDCGSIVGLIDGLRLGANTVEARRGTRVARLQITNHPIEGPIVSGEHLKLFVCQTAQSGL